MSGGFGYRNWIANVPFEGPSWPEREELVALSKRAFDEQIRPVRHAGRLLPGDIALIAVVRNEAQRLPLFFEHYKKLGVTRFLMVDNASEDATAEVLLAESAADIFHTEASYRDACSGIYWHNGLACAYCIGHWTLMADADELFVYDGMDRHGLPELTKWLERGSQDRVFAPMIDVYPPDVIGETGLTVRENLLQNSWFDTTGYALQRKAGGWLATGGPRQRLFSEEELTHGAWASKYPLFKMKSETVIYNAHFIWPRDEGLARPMGALMHLKFMDDFAARSAQNERQGQHYDNARRYRIINRKLVEQPRLIAAYSRSEKYTGPESLVRHHLLLPIDWDSETPSYLRTLGDIDYRPWVGVGSPATIPASERSEFEDFSRRAFQAHLTTVRCQGRLAPGEIGLICVLRNEVARLPLFFDHYKRLGVTRFFMIDNDSEDGSHDLLLAEPKADIFRTGASFSEGQAGLYWAHAVARRYGEGNWLIRPDADELFVYDGMEEHGLGDLARWLEVHGMDRVFTPMIDLYPSAPLGRSSQTIEEQIKTDSWFDNDGYSLTRWPQGWRLTGGPRHRLFHRDDSHRNLMWKYPFFRMTPDTLIFNHHWLWPYDDVTRGALGAMVHLKLMHDFIERSQRYEAEAQHWNGSVAYRIVNQKMKDMPDVMAFYEGSKRYRGPRSLIRHGMLMPIDWEDEARTFADQNVSSGGP
jgi:hypothetical protein